MRRLEADDSVETAVNLAEWSFLQSNSWFGSQSWRPFKAFLEAGAYVLEVGKRTGINLLEQVIPKEHIPPQVTPKLVGLGAVKWLAVGGVSVGGGSLGGLVGSLSGNPAVTWGGAKAGGIAGGALSRAAFLAIDP